MGAFISGSADSSSLLGRLHSPGPITVANLQDAKTSFRSLMQEESPVLVEPAPVPASRGSVAGDPLICPANGRDTGDCHYYMGPAVLACVNSLGHVSALEFVGTCDYNGNNCQTPQGDYVGEIWRFDTKTGDLKYHDARGHGNLHVTCGDWRATPVQKKGPTRTWLAGFTETS